MGRPALATNARLLSNRKVVGVFTTSERSRANSARLALAPFRESVGELISELHRDRTQQLFVCMGGGEGS